MNGQVGFHFDETRCVGCATCAVACSDGNDVPPGPGAWRRLVTQEQGQFPQVTVAFFPLSCLHCEDAPCVRACLPRAIQKRPRDGIVTLDPQKCRPHCRRCAAVCPFGVPQFDQQGLALPMCDFCSQRQAAGQKPLCILACPQRALDAGPVETLKEKYGSGAWPRALTDPRGCRPALVTKGKPAHQG
ncbi:MAG: 4Fe-4S dicluster domain-containing protein [Chloroflexi bacterium]|nr:4Fe-4S dicluster domain-containing protein [Chloroflexota bacterium]